MRKLLISAVALLFAGALCAQESPLWMLQPGKTVAFLEDRTAIRVINLKTKKVRTVMDARYQYSYSDGDQWFEWGVIEES